MKFNTKQELYDYLNNFDFDSVKDTKLSSVYFLVEYDTNYAGCDNYIEPIYFTSFEDVWFESPCYLSKYRLRDDEVMDFVQCMYYEDYWEDAYEYEKTMQKYGWHYEIDCPQCCPFLPSSIKIVDVFSDSKCLDWKLSQLNKE